MKPILKISNPPARKRRDAGFTLTELLVILAVVAIIACVQCAALAGGRGRTVITECASHLRQFDLAVQLYANDHADCLPAPVLSPPFYRAPGSTPQDISVQVVNDIAPYGATRNVFYCPANPGFNSDLTWNYGLQPPSGGFRIMGYVTALPDIRGIPPNLLNTTLTPPSDSNGSSNPPPLPSQRVLLADLTISYNGSYDQISIGGLPSATIKERTSHLDGKYPLGGNIGMLDGHVEWRPFSDMHVAFGNPTFHW